MVLKWRQLDVLHRNQEPLQWSLDSSLWVEKFVQIWILENGLLQRSNPTMQNWHIHLHDRRSCRRIRMVILLPKTIVKKEQKGKYTWLEYTPVTYLIYSATPMVKTESSSRNSSCTRNPTKYTYFSPPGLIFAFFCATFNNYLGLFHITTRFHMGLKRNCLYDIQQA
jgi:hypothetical protein